VNANVGLVDVAEEIKAAGGKCYPYYCDITNKEEVYRVAKTVQIEVGNVREKLKTCKNLTCYNRRIIPEGGLRRSF
jgi:hypothetical protein